MMRGRPSFVPFEERNAVRIYRRNLPHWRQTGATYFVTFRLGDSIPQAVVDQWEYEKRLWLAARGVRSSQGDGNWQSEIEQLSESDRPRFHKHFNRLFHAALDQGAGGCDLKMPDCLATLRNRLLECDSKSVHIGDFVVMPNHVHLLLVPVSGFELEQILKGIKGAAARWCNVLLGRGGRFWQPDSYDHIVRDLSQLAQFRQYIADNPSKAGITLAADALYHADWMDAWTS